MSSSFRLIELHDRLNKGELIKKEETLEKFGIDSKTFQRDIDKLRIYYTENYLGEIIYDRKHNCYRLESNPAQLTKQEIFVICKILIESRALNKSEFTTVVEKLLKLCQKDEAKQVYKAIKSAGRVKSRKRTS